MSKQIATLTFTQFQEELRKLDIPISPEKANDLIADGRFRGVVYGTSPRSYLILKKDFDAWVERYAEEPQIRQDCLDYAKSREEATT